MEDRCSYLKLSSHRPQGNKSYKKIYVSQVSARKGDNPGERMGETGEAGNGIPIIKSMQTKKIMHCGGDQS